MNKRSHLFKSLFLFAAILVAGAGCKQSKQEQPNLIVPPTSNVSMFEGLTSEQATARINFVPGSVIELRQTAFGFGAKLADFLAGDSKEGLRTIVIDRFAPREIANVSWQLKTKEETEESVKARKEAIAKKALPPEVAYDSKTYAGTLVGFNMKDGHSLYLPAFWPEKDNAGTFGSSGLWLSADVYDSLSRNRVGTLDFGLFDPALPMKFQSDPSLKGMFAELEKYVKTIQDRVDVNVLNGETELVDWSLRVNGEDIKVQVIKARNWFGEIVVLNNMQNPLVLKLTVNPIAAGVTDALKGTGTLTGLLGYEVTGLIDVQR
ncbi:MAG: hypothetical protein AAB386_04385 [Patescibacteria group bacterium]